MAAPGDPDPLPVVDSGWDVDRQLDPLHLAATAAAVVARRLRDAAVAVAPIARRRLHDLPQRSAQHRSQLTRALALGTGLDRRAGLGAVAVAGLAQHDRLEGAVDRRASDYLVERDLGRYR